MTTREQAIPATPEQRRPTSVRRVIMLPRNNGTEEAPVIERREFTLVFDFAAIGTLEDLYDCPLRELGEKFKDVKSLRIRDVQRLMYAGLRTHHAAVSLDGTLTLLNEAVGAGMSVGDLLSEAFSAFDAGAGQDKAGGDDAEDPRTAG